jgi:hypothetical protein
MLNPYKLIATCITALALMGLSVQATQAEEKANPLSGLHIKTTYCLNILGYDRGCYTENAMGKHGVRKAIVKRVLEHVCFHEDDLECMLLRSHKGLLIVMSDEALNTKTDVVVWQKKANMMPMIEIGEEK